MANVKVVEDGEREIWLNPNNFPIYLMLTATNGNRVDQVVQPGGTVSVTPNDRKEIQAKKLFNPAKDPFTNGRLQPVQLLQNDKDFEELITNPNVLPPEDAAELINGPIGKLRDFLSDVTNEDLVERLLDQAGELDASKNKLKAIQARLDELKPAADPESLYDTPDEEGITVVEM